MRKILFAACIAAGCAWSFFTGDWVAPSLLALVTVPAWGMVKGH